MSEMNEKIVEEANKPIRARCGDEAAYKLTRKAIVKFFQKNPNPTDKQLHAWAEDHGHDPSDVEDIVYKLTSEHVKVHLTKSEKEMVEHLQETGLHKKGQVLKIDARELALGIKVELEHTPSRKVAREIALDHLHEDSKYYTHLKAMEKKHMKKSLMKGKAGTRGVPDGSGPEGKGPTGRQSPPQKPKRGDFDSDETFFRALKRWQYSQKGTKKSRMEGKMEKSGLALVIFPGELTKAAKLSGVGAKHPAGLSSVGGKTKSKIPYTSHTERMALAKMAAERMMAPKPENEGKYADTPEVDRKGREKGQKPAGAVGSTGVSGEGSQAHENFGRETVIVNPTDLGAGRPESAAKYGGVKKVTKPRS